MRKEYSRAQEDQPMILFSALRLSNSFVVSTKSAFHNCKSPIHLYLRQVTPKQRHEEQRFQQKFKEVKQQQLSFNVKMSMAEGFSLMCLLIAFTLTFWYGSECVQGTSNCPRGAGRYTGGTVLTVFFSLIIPAINLNQLAPSLKAVAEGKQATSRLFSVIDRKPLIQSPSNPFKLEQLRGQICFRNVHFAYPKDKARPVLQGLTMDISCKHSGIMGESGCGKSTLLQLLMRFYDPLEGAITIDGINILNFDLQWLRNQIAFVGQEPYLLSSTIEENLRIGSPNATEEDINKALLHAEALEFVNKFSQKTKTYVGRGGGQLSGGQKQRIAIARALIKNTPILLLDEATSALDQRNQKLIQNTLTRLKSGKVSITVAHRLQTIMNSDQIYIINAGKLQEHGRFDELSVKDKFTQYIENKEQENIEEDEDAQRKRKKQSQQDNTLEALKQEQTNKVLVDQKTIAPDLVLTNKQQGKDIYSRLFSYTKDNRSLIVIGILSSLINGIVIPSMGIHVARMLSFNLMYSFDPSYYRQQISTQCLYMLITCICGPFAIGLQYAVFLNLGCTVVNKIRQQAYKKILRLPIAWFEDKNNHAQEISIRLGADIYNMNHVISRYISHLCVALSSIIFGILLAFYFEWRTALISLGLLPLIGVAGSMQAKMASGYLNDSKGLYEQSSEIVSQSITNLKSILSYCHENHIKKEYSRKLEKVQDSQYKQKLISGFFFGLSFFAMFIVYGALFYLSALFLRDNHLQMTNAFSAVFLILFAGSIAGNNLKNIPNIGVLKSTAEQLFRLIDLEDETELQMKRGSKMLDRDLKGDICFRNVRFKYDGREEAALRNVSFQVKAGEKAILVGASGCGKSTILKLLLGFYQCQSGEIRIDGELIDDWDIRCLRRHFGTVSQEPELFDETVQYNITYNQTIDQGQMMKAIAKAQLIYQSLEDAQQFIERKVGPRGCHLSGGQKQRIAIARMAVGHPRVLLLDEATSALDKENQAKVQLCLNAISEEATTLTVTHKLDSLKDSKNIFVFDGGQIVENGSHEQLMKHRGAFFRLCRGIVQ